MPNPSLPIVVLISGGGTTLRNLIEKIDRERLPLDIRLVVASKADARGLRFAEEADIPTAVVRRDAHPDIDSFSRDIFDRCRLVGAELVVMGGFLKRVVIPDGFTNRVVNIHPALIPAFCGQGMYGHRVHQAAIDYGVKLSGCTVHFADNEYDHGPVILQRAVPVMDDDTADMLAARVFEAECQAYPDALRLIAEGRIHVDGRRVRVMP
jgi:formyltetrahydrofolate-dependent phosphoribosylglycinamide formyltransferase